MKIGAFSSHAYGVGGGFQALKWIALACQKLGHEITIHVRNSPSEAVLAQWPSGIPMRSYSIGCESEYDVAICVDHFAWSPPLAKRNVAFVFFPQDKLPPPPDGVKLYAVSDYTARHIKNRWDVEAETLYLPISKGFYAGDKEKIILHVSRFTEPSEYSDKAHEQMILAFKSISRKIPGWRLALAGSIDPHQGFYYDKLQRLAAGFPIDFAPNWGQKELADLYARSAIYYHATGVSLSTVPGAQEHLGLAPIEAQASGCVPIVYNSGGMPEVVLDHKTGLLFDNIMELPKLTLELISNMQAWASMSQAGQLWAQQWADFDAFTRRIDDMLNDRPIMRSSVFGIALKASQSDVTIVIPTMNSPLLNKCLVSLNKTVPNSKILIMNNGGSLSLSDEIDVSNIRVVDLVNNLGFAGALRRAKSLVDTSLTMILNDDTEMRHQGWMEQLLLVMNNGAVGVVGPKLVFGDGRIQFAGGIIDANRDDIGSHRAYGRPDGIEVSAPMETDFITGAALLCRTELFDMPEELSDTLNYEDVWLCFSAKEKGYKVVYQPASVITHFEGETKKRTPDIQGKVDAARNIFRDRWMK